jgi:hypothetical protein
MYGRRGNEVPNLLITRTLGAEIRTLGTKPRTLGTAFFCNSMIFIEKLQYFPAKTLKL